MELNKFAVLLIGILFLSFISQAQTRIIFDTDIGGDADDLGALAMLPGDF